jgi:NDP-sugar pyrophosphorylase family protein
MLVGSPEHAAASSGQAPSARARATAEAIVLCGGHWRRHAFAPSVPRPLLPIAQVPLIVRTLDALVASEFKRASVCTNTASRQIEARLLAGLHGLDATVREDLTPRGPAGCVRDAALHSDADAFLVIEGSVVVTIDLGRLLSHHRATRAAVTIVVQPPQAGAPGTRAELPAGIYVFDRSVLDVIPTAGFYDIKESLIPRLHRAGEPTAVYEAESWCPRVLDAQSYHTANQWLICEAVRPSSPHTPFGDGRQHPRNADALVHPTARVDDGALLVGPVLVGPGVEIMRGATVVGPASLGRDTVVQQGALVSRSVLWERATIGRDALVDRCVIADDVTIEPSAQMVEAVRVPQVRRAVWGHRTMTWFRPSRNRAATLANAPAR